MSQLDPDPHRRPGATVAQLKADIDSGRTGDKVGGLDPGAAPLGTDAEAGGAPHDPDAVALMRVQERAARPADAAPNAATPELQPDGRLKGHGLALPIAAGLGAAILLAGLLAAAL